MVAENTNDSAFIGGNSKQYHKDTGRAACRQTSALCRVPLKSVGHCVCVQEWIWAQPLAGSKPSEIDVAEVVRERKPEFRSELSVSGCVSASPGNVSETEASAESTVSSFSLARKTKHYAAFGTLPPAFVCHSCKLLWARTVSYVCSQHLAQWGHGLGWGLRFCCNTNTNQLWNFMKDYFLPGIYLWRMQLY